eukprot:tig00000980_g6151.t1
MTDKKRRVSFNNEVDTRTIPSRDQEVSHDKTVKPAGAPGSRKQRRKQHVRKAILKKKKAEVRKLKRESGELPEIIKKNNPGKARELALEYLDAWSSSRSENVSPWKFQKVRQAWLIKHLFESRVPKNDFPTLLEYLKPLQGCALEELLARAREILRRYAAGEEDPAEKELDHDDDDAAAPEEAAEEAPQREARRRRNRAKRARRVISALGGEEPPELPDEPPAPAPPAPAGPSSKRPAGAPLREDAGDGSSDGESSSGDEESSDSD